MLNVRSRLCESAKRFIEYLLMTVEVKEGEEQKPLKFTTSMSMSRGERLVFARRSSMMGKSTICTSLMDSVWSVFGGM